MSNHSESTFKPEDHGFRRPAPQEVRVGLRLAYLPLFDPTLQMEQKVLESIEIRDIHVRSFPQGDHDVWVTCVTFKVGRGKCWAPLWDLCYGDSMYLVPLTSPTMPSEPAALAA